MADLVVDPDRRLLARLGHDQPKVQPQHPVVGPAMRRQVLARVEDREHRRLQPRDPADRLPGLWAERDVLLRADPEAAEEEGLPGGVLRDRPHVGRDVLEVRQLVLAGHHPLQLGADRGKGPLHLGGPGEGRVVVDRRVAVDRVAAVELLGPLDDAGEEAGDCARPLHGSDAVGAEGLPGGSGHDLEREE